MNTANTKLAPLGLCVLALTLGACANEPTQSQQTFGDSVRNMVRAQTNDPSTLTNPSAETPEGSDGQRLENAVEAYRDGVTKPEQGGGGVVINVGGGG
jgi:type IV pilus biogenesis protein CpaD/CtpE